MAITVTPEDIKNICDTDLPDEFIQDLIDLVAGRIGECLESNYDEKDANTIVKWMVCYLVDSSSSSGDVKSEKAPNGASTTYADAVTKDGLESNRYGRLVYQLDYAGCWQSMIQTGQFIDSIGGTNPPCNGCF